MHRASRAAILAASAALALGGCDVSIVATAHAGELEPTSLTPQYGAPAGYTPPPPLDPLPTPPLKVDAGTGSGRH